LTRLNSHAKQTLDVLTEKHRAYQIAKLTIEAELKDELVERLSSYKQERDIALRLAEEAGVPRTHLGKAIGTSNYRTVQEILAETASEVVRPDIADDSSGKWSLTRLPNKNYVLEVFGIGVGNIRGSAEIVFDSYSNEIVFVDGDPSVVPAVYRDNYAEEIIASVV
jgi:NACalpha-BTF3-like transcription factor